jgi:catechol 2,3-dioxygenase-like lactoylglutathione lyase family enzyme
MGVRTIGCHHMAFVTNDMEETVKFYNGILGFPVVSRFSFPTRTAVGAPHRPQPSTVPDFRCEIR